MQQIQIRLAIATVLVWASVWAGGAEAQTTPKSGEMPLVIALDAADCRRIVAQHDAARIVHQPNADVTYRPGRDVDASGRPIVPADLPGSNPMPMTGPITLPLNIALSELLGSRTPPRVGVSELNVVRIAIDPVSGKVAFDGRPLEQSGENAVTAACREYLSGQGKPR